MDDPVVTDVKQHLPTPAANEHDEESEFTARRESASALDAKESVPRRHMVLVRDMDSDGELASTDVPTITDQNTKNQVCLNTNSTPQSQPKQQFVDFVTAISCEEVGVEHQREQVIECVECKRRFTSDKALADHFRTHTGECVHIVTASSRPTCRRASVRMHLVCPIVRFVTRDGTARVEGARQRLTHV
jgi:hypothetical protein